MPKDLLLMDQVQEGKLIETWDAMVELKKTLGICK